MLKRILVVLFVGPIIILTGCIQFPYEGVRYIACGKFGDGPTWLETFLKWANKNNQ